MCEICVVGAQAFFLSLLDFVVPAKSNLQCYIHTVTHNSRRNRSVLYFIEYAASVLVSFAVCFFLLPYMQQFLYIFFFVFYWYLVFEIVIWYIDCCGETLCGIVDDEDVALVECDIHLFNNS